MGCGGVGGIVTDVFPAACCWLAKRLWQAIRIAISEQCWSLEINLIQIKSLLLFIYFYCVIFCYFIAYQVLNSVYNWMLATLQ